MRIMALSARFAKHWDRNVAFCYVFICLSASGRGLMQITCTALKQTTFTAIKTASCLTCKKLRKTWRHFHIKSISWNFILKSFYGWFLSKIKITNYRLLCMIWMIFYINSYLQCSTFVKTNLEQIQNLFAFVFCLN